MSERVETNSAGLIKLVNKPDVSFEQPKTLVDFKIINEMLKKHEARSKENFIVKRHYEVNFLALYLSV